MDEIAGKRKSRGSVESKGIVQMGRTGGGLPAGVSRKGKNE